MEFHYMGIFLREHRNVKKKPNAISTTTYRKRGEVGRHVTSPGQLPPLGGKTRDSWESGVSGFAKRSLDLMSKATQDVTNHRGLHLVSHPIHQSSHHHPLSQLNYRTTVAATNLVQGSAMLRILSTRFYMVHCVHSL